MVDTVAKYDSNVSACIVRVCVCGCVGVDVVVQLNCDDW